MKSTVTFALVLALALLTGTAAWAKSEYHLDEDADFSEFKTYRWTQGAEANKGGVEKQIKASVDRELQEHGLTPAAEDGPADLDVATFVLTETNLESWNAVAATQWGTVWSYQVRDITNGTLVIRITRSGSQEMVYHVMEQQVVEPGLTSLQIQRKVDRIITKLFKKYPRPKKK